MEKNKNRLELKVFHFLVKDYNFRLIRNTVDNYGFHLTYCNTTTGVDLYSEYRDGYLSVMLYRLINGHLVNNPELIDENTKLNGFALDYIVELRAPNEVPEPFLTFGPDGKTKLSYSAYLQKYASNLRKYAYDVLEGDFTIFKPAEKIFRKRFMG